MVLVCARFGTVGNILLDSFVVVVPFSTTAAAVVAVPGDSDRCSIRFRRIALAYRVDVIGDDAALDDDDDDAAGLDVYESSRVLLLLLLLLLLL